MTRATRRPLLRDEMPATGRPRAEDMYAQDEGTPARWQDAPKTAPSGLPLVIAEWPRNSREIVHISLDRFNTFTIDVRTWWRDANGTFKPGPAGLTLPSSTFGNSPKVSSAPSGAQRRSASWRRSRATEALPSDSIDIDND